jgi:hypothetical protein
MKFNNETLRAAVKEWLGYETSVWKRVFLSNPVKKYGHISDWDTSEVRSVSDS